jgi:hypothetical protein
VRHIGLLTIATNGRSQRACSAMDGHSVSPFEEGGAWRWIGHLDPTHHFKGLSVCALIVLVRPIVLCQRQGRASTRDAARGENEHGADH